MAEAEDSGTGDGEPGAGQHRQGEGWVSIWGVGQDLPSEVL